MCFELAQSEWNWVNNLYTTIDIKIGKTKQFKTKYTKLLQSMWHLAPVKKKNHIWHIQRHLLFTNSVDCFVYIRKIMSIICFKSTFFIVTVKLMYGVSNSLSVYDSFLSFLFGFPSFFSIIIEILFTYCKLVDFRCVFLKTENKEWQPKPILE